ncbi:hypothetical protein RN053_16055 [Pantoea dispersa]|uniref:hypothetical protein n=1 Tax=Pantoea dispersa TaxID=59814 RepID=UPI0028DDA2B5|nr:hypothetical protein [Pantoea dispersa]MDT8852015.1 hypothetical protein [Pantoea dispersa]
MKQVNRPASDLYALIGSAVTEFIREGSVFRIHDVTQVLHTMKAEARDEDFRHRCDAAIRLLADLMH